jgi:hypothetical protein
MPIITFDATALSLSKFLVSGTKDLPNTKPRAIELKPGPYTFGTLTGPSFPFMVTSAGNVDFATGPLDTFVTGRGTKAMRVDGFHITVDATPLSLHLFDVQDPASGLGVGDKQQTSAVAAYTLIPGTYRFANDDAPDLRSTSPTPAGSTTRPARSTRSWLAVARRRCASTGSR